MLNREINSRFEDWLLAPREALDFEVKRWLNMTDVESQGLVAKALIALENHGGGFLLFGYREDQDKVLVPDSPRPASLQPYLADAINAILKKRAEPAFHVEVSVQRHPESGDEYPLVQVPGTSKVPVRSCSETSAGALRNYVYYIRASGPESRGPMNAAEWDGLIRRALANQREELVGLFRSIFRDSAVFVSKAEEPPADSGKRIVYSNRVVEEPSTDSQTPSRTHCAKLPDFIADSEKRWAALNSSLPPDHPAKIAQGYYTFGACIAGVSKRLTSRAILDANAEARRYTGWPVFIADYAEPTKPKMVDGTIQAWLAHARIADVGHADFWRIDPGGQFFLLRGYQEDTLDPTRKIGEPGKLFEVTLPVWRVGEFLVRVRGLADSMFEEGFEMRVHCKWRGIAGRHLFSHGWRRATPGGVAVVDSVETEGRFPQSVVRDLLPEAVKALTSRLYDHFDFFQPSDAFYVEELDAMLNGRF